MSVVIKNMDMPKSCIECPCSLNLFYCKVNRRAITSHGGISIEGTNINVLKPDWCPMIGLPPEARIDNTDLGNPMLTAGYIQGWNEALSQLR